MIKEKGCLGCLSRDNDCFAKGTFYPLAFAASNALYTSRYPMIIFSVALFHFNTLTHYYSTLSLLLCCWNSVSPHWKIEYCLLACWLASHFSLASLEPYKASSIQSFNTRLILPRFTLISKRRCSASRLDGSRTCSDRRVCDQAAL